MGRKTWNKGYTKENHPSLLKMSRTIKQKGINNFKDWREKMIKAGIIRVEFSPLPHNELTSELIGVTLGDGNISVFPRCERLIISSHSSNKKFIERYSKIVEKLFEKKPSVNKTKQNCVRISLYQKYISKRLSIPAGSRSSLDKLIPKWIKQDRNFTISCLKGLFEAEGSLNIHLPTYTYNFAFSNTNTCLLNFAKDGLVMLGFHPEQRSNAIRLRKKGEVEKFRKLINFREYVYSGID